MLDTIPGYIAGLRIMESPMLTESEEITVPRTWKERLWSWPWQPFRATKTITRQVPSRKGCILMGTAFMCHPMLAAELRQKLNLPAS